MIFKRNIYAKLLEWKNSAAGAKALLIEGARRAKTIQVRILFPSEAIKDEEKIRTQDF